METNGVFRQAGRLQCDKSGEEVTFGTVNNDKEAYAWLENTYLFIRMKINHLAYGIRQNDVVVDHTLSSKQRSQVIDIKRVESLNGLSNVLDNIEIPLGDLII